MTPAKIIADNLAALPHPDGAPRQMPGFSSRLLPEPIRQQVDQAATDIGVAIIHLLESNGYTITNSKTPPSTEPAEQPAPIANLYCSLCNTRLLSLNIADPTHCVTNGPMLLEAMAARSPGCPHQ